MQQAACQAITNLAASVDGALALLKTGFVADAVKLLRSATIRADDRNPSAMDSTVPVLHVLAALASHDEGQRQLLRTNAQPSVLEALAELLTATQHPEASATALLVLRNIALHRENKSWFLADPRCAHHGLG